MSLSRSIRIDSYSRRLGGLGSDQLDGGPSAAYRVQSFSRLPAVNSRICRLWRHDNRYAGTVTVCRDAESDGVVLEFDALRHGGRSRRRIVHPHDVDKLILSLLEVRSRKHDSLDEERAAGASATMSATDREQER